MAITLKSNIHKLQRYFESTCQKKAYSLFLYNVDIKLLYLFFTWLAFNTLQIVKNTESVHNVGIVPFLDIELYDMTLQSQLFLKSRQVVDLTQNQMNV